MRSDRPTLSELFASSGALFKEGAGQSAAVLAAGLVPGALIAAAAFVGTGILSRESLSTLIQDGRWTEAAPLFAAGLIKKLLAFLAFAALVLSLEAREAGRPITTGEAYAAAWKRLPALAASAALAALAIAGGMLLLIVPGVILALRYTFVHLAVLVEERGGRDALRRSSQLVRAQPRRALGYLLAATVLAVLLNVAAAFAVALTTGGAAALGPGEVGVLQGQAEALLSELTQSVVGAWLAGFSILLYRDLVQAASDPELE
jgi:hypothetical protein